MAGGPGWGLRLVRKPEQDLEPLASLTRSFLASVPQARRLPDSPAGAEPACMSDTRHQSLVVIPTPFHL